MKELTPGFPSPPPLRRALNQSKAGAPLPIHTQKQKKLLLEKIFIRSFFIIVCNIPLTNSNNNMRSRSSRVPLLCILILPLEVSLLRFETFPGSWIPFSNSVESTLFHPSFGFASGFFVHPLEEIARTLRAF